MSEADAPGPSGVLFDVQRWSTEDGPGIRTTVFFKGCPLRCAWCCNPESWSPRPELGLFPERCRGCDACVTACPRDLARPAREPRSACEDLGACVAACPHGARQIFGQAWTVEALLAHIERDRVFHRRSGGGVTFSGGEATAQPEFLRHLAERLREWGVHLALETCGHFAWEENAEALACMDLVYLDLKHMDEAEHRRWTGVGTALIHANARRLRQAGIPLILRLPLIPGVNDDAENLRRMAAFAAELESPVEVLPCHALGVAKHQAIGAEPPLRDLKPPDPARVAQVQEALRGSGARILG